MLPTWALSIWTRRLYLDCVIWWVYYQEYSFMIWYNWLSVDSYLSYHRVHHHDHYTINHHHQLSTMDYHFSIHRTTSPYATTFRRRFSHRTIESGA